MRATLELVVKGDSWGEISHRTHQHDSSVTVAADGWIKLTVKKGAVMSYNPTKSTPEVEAGIYLTHDHRKALAAFLLSIPDDVP